ncbi:MAG: FkbM family methyltransferase [Patescibacteria group bacterium]|jgi:FkbM family methyltransferase
MNMATLRNYYLPLYDIYTQSQDSLGKKIQFLLATGLHYSLKKFGIRYIKMFPELELELFGYRLKTRKETLDFWACWKNYEIENTKFFLDASIEKPIFIDVEAHIGRYSVLMAKRGCEVHSFEPMESNYRQLYANALLNGVEDKIHFHKYGLGNKEASTKIYFEIHKHGEASITPEKKNLKSEEISIKKLDDIFPDKMEKQIILKIDTEGFENEIIKGGAEFIKKNRPILVVEIWEKNGEEIVEFLRSLNYKYSHGEVWMPDEIKFRLAPSSKYVNGVNFLQR